MESPENFPAPVRCIYERLKDDGIYLLGTFLANIETIILILKTNTK